MNKLPKLRDLLKLCILLALLMHMTQAYSSGNGTYRTNFCLCQMDIYLLKVRQMLSLGQVPPATPPTTTPGPSTTNTATTIANAGTTTTNTGTTTTNTGTTTTNTGTTSTNTATTIANAGTITTNTGTTSTNTATTIANAGTTTTNTGTTTTNTATTATNTGSTTTAGSITSAATGLSTSTTQAAIGKRRKRQAAASTTVATTKATTQITTKAPTTASAQITTKAPTTASAQKITLGLARDYIAGISTPTFGVVFDGSVKLVDDYGVIFDSNYNPSLCPCATNQTVEVSLCLLNVPYNSSYGNINSTQSHDIVGRLLPWLDDTLIKAFNSNPIYIRVLPKKIQSYNNKSAQIVVSVNLRNVTYQPDYYVNNAINPSLTVVIQPADVTGFQVDNTQTGCYSVVDVTPAIPVVRTAAYYLRFIAIPVALAVLALMIFCTCCGSRDQFYVRFW